MECVYSHGTSKHGVSKPICQKKFQSSPPKPFMGRLKLFKNPFKPTIAEDVTSFKNYPGWILGYKIRIFYLFNRNRPLGFLSRVSKNIIESICWFQQTMPVTMWLLFAGVTTLVTQ